MNLKKFAYFDLAGTLAHGYFVSPVYLRYSQLYFPRQYPAILAYYNDLLEQIKDGRLEYNDSVFKINSIMAELIKGQSVAKVIRTADECFRDVKVYPYVAPLFRYLQAQGFRIVIITADHEILLGQILKQLPQPFEVHSSVFEVRDGKFTGRIARLPNDQVKLDTIRKLEAEAKHTLTIAFGDSDGDIPMLHAADLGFLLKAPLDSFKKPKVNSNVVYIGSPESETVCGEMVSRIDTLLGSAGA